jgi:DnaJ family protein C protein 28
MEAHDWENYVDQQIRQAQEEGQFDNLPGKGKPFKHLGSDPLGQVLESQGFAPRWMELDREIREKIEIAEQSIRRTYEWVMQTWSSGSANQQFAEGEWQEAQRVFAKRLDEINQLIQLLNLELPPAVRHLQRFPLKKDQQLRRMGLPIQLE